MKNEDRLLTISDLEKMTQLSRRYLYLKIESGELPAYRFGNVKGMRVKQKDAERFIESKKIR